MPLVLVVGVAACEPERSERELAVAAAALATSGDVEAARAAFVSALQKFPASVEIRVRLAEFLTTEGDLNAARAVLDELAAMPAGDEERRRALQVERDWYRALLMQSRGENLLEPADREGYELAVTSLLARDRDATLMTEWGDYLMARARQAILAEPTLPIDLNDPDNPAALANPDQARQALVQLDRLIDGDPILREPPTLEPALQSEAVAVREILRGIVFGAEFDRTFAELHRPRMVDDGRYEVASNVFTIRYDGPVPVELPPESGADVYEQLAEHLLAREMATDLAFDLRGMSRDDAPPLPFLLEDMAGTEASGLVVDEQGGMQFSVRIPYETVRRAAFLLQRRMDDEVARSVVPAPTEDSGEPPDGPSADDDDE
ncbi:MAG: tetratricopeptide repeat protein [Myxococcales bacterium]|nr:tetratricopeptide repeat protein [Myxococcales bacterium]